MSFCTSPVTLPSNPTASFRCGVCFNCRKAQQMEWCNRMILEQFQKDYRPQFITGTFSDEYLPDNVADTKKYWQKYLKRLRKQVDGTIRYFFVIERGTKNGRIHCHAILWNKNLAMMEVKRAWEIQHKEWKAGRYQSEPIRKTGGFWYVAKYISKNLIKNSQKPSEGAKYNRLFGNMENPGRLYTWSNKPRLGDAGLSRWEYLAKKQIDRGVVPPSYINLPILGNLHKCWIPRDTYFKYLRENGIVFTWDDQEEEEIEPIDGITPESVDEELRKQRLEREAEMYRNKGDTEDE